MATKQWVGTDTGNEGDYSTAANWSPSGVPAAADVVILPGNGSQAITAGLDQSAIALASFIVEDGFSGAIATSAAYLEIDSDSIRFDGSGTAYIDTGSNPADIDITGTATATSGSQGLYIIGTGIDDLSIKSGTVGVAVLPGEVSTIDSARVLGGKLTTGAGVTLVTLEAAAGTTTNKANVSTVKVFGGTVNSEVIGQSMSAAVTLYSFGGTYNLNGSGNITTLHLSGGTVDTTNSGIAKTVAYIYFASGTLKADPNVFSVLVSSVIGPSTTANRQPVTIKVS
jgi:hypothetical protein